MRCRRTFARGLIGAFAASWTVSATAAEHLVPLFTSAADTERQGFVQITNHSLEAGEVRVDAVDDNGQRFGPVVLTIGPDEAAHFNSNDLEHGNATKGLAGSTGSGHGDWRLVVETDLDVEVLSYLRTPDGFLTAMHDVVPTDGNGHWVPIFNPASNVDQVSMLRLVNPGEDEVVVTIEGKDDVGESTDRLVRATVAAGASRTLTAVELESGAPGMEGRLGDGMGKWQLTLESDRPILVMSLLKSPTGQLSNLSSLPGGLSDVDAGRHRVPFFPSASDAVRQGFIRVINRSGQAGEVRIEAIDDQGVSHGPVTLNVGAGETAHLNSDDLELGNGDKGLSIGTGEGIGDWRLELSSELDIDVLSYTRTGDGFLTAMHDVVPSFGPRHRVAIFNPGRNVNQVSHLRVVNLGDDTAHIAIEGVDGKANGSNTPLTASIMRGGARTFTARELESAFGLAERLGYVAGKWRLTVESEPPGHSVVGILSFLRQPILAMSLLESPAGHLTNLSTATRCTGHSGFREALADGGEGPEMEVIAPGRFEMGCGSDDCPDVAKPVREVTFEEPFALSRSEVTFAQWDACVAGGGCNGYRPRDRYWGRLHRPVIYVGRDDAEAYASWLSRQTGAEYRLPSEAEWEYAARAGTTTRQSWGDAVGEGRANCLGCGGHWDALRWGALFLIRGGTAPVGSFAANAFCLNDMHGNVGEWVADWWNETYDGAPVDGSAWLSGDATALVFRGGSWAFAAETISTDGRGYALDPRTAYIGFRVARTLE